MAGQARGLVPKGGGPCGLASTPPRRRAQRARPALTPHQTTLPRGPSHGLSLAWRQRSTHRAHHGSSLARDKTTERTCGLVTGATPSGQSVRAREAVTNGTCGLVTGARPRGLNSQGRVSHTRPSVPALVRALSRTPGLDHGSPFACASHRGSLCASYTRWRRCASASPWRLLRSSNELAIGAQGEGGGPGQRGLGGGVEGGKEEGVWGSGAGGRGEGSGTRPGAREKALGLREKALALPSVRWGSGGRLLHNHGGIESIVWSK